VLLPLPPNGRSTWTFEIQINVIGTTSRSSHERDYPWLSTSTRDPGHGINCLSPSIRPGTIPSGSSDAAVLLFIIPTDQPALQLTWRFAPYSRGLRRATPTRRW